MAGGAGGRPAPVEGVRDPPCPPWGRAGGLRARLYVDDLNSQCQFRGDTVLTQWSYQSVNITAWVMVLVGMAVGFRVVARPGAGQPSVRDGGRGLYPEFVHPRDNTNRNPALIRRR